MEGNRICSFTGCNNTGQTDNFSFHEFPYDFNLCMQWIEIIGTREYFEDFAFQGAEAFCGRFLCSDHFTEEDFIDGNNIFSGLKEDAVPFYFIPNRKPEDPMENISVKTEPLNGDFWNILNNVKVEDESSHFSASEHPLQPEFFSIGAKSRKSQVRRATVTPDKLAERRLRDARRVYLNRQRETPEETERRRKACAERQAKKRKLETPEQREIRRMKDLLRTRRRRQKEIESPKEQEMRRRANAERQARKRMLETPEQREIRRVKDLLRARKRREMESEEEKKLRRIQDAARAQARRQNESEEETMVRKVKDLERITKRRDNETDEERMERLKKNREYTQKRRLFQRWENELNHPNNVINDNYSVFRNLEQDVAAVSANFFQSLLTYTEQGCNQLDVGVLSSFNSPHSILGHSMASKSTSDHLSNLLHSNFALNSSLDSNSFDGTSGESTTSLSRKSSDKEVKVLPIDVRHREYYMNEKKAEFSTGT